MRNFNFKSWVVKNKNLFLIILSIFAIRWSILDHYRVPSGSMIPTIEIGDDIFVSKITYQLKVPFTEVILFKFNDITPGEIVVFSSPVDGINYVKRVVGVPGDNLKIINGFIYRNHQLVAKFEGEGVYSYLEPWGEVKATIQRDMTKLRPMEVEVNLGTDQYFMMGDNRDNSFDSRFFGPVDRNLIKGKVYFVMWSFSLDNYFPYFKFSRTGHYFY